MLILTLTLLSAPAVSPGLCADLKTETNTSYNVVTYGARYEELMKQHRKKLDQFKKGMEPFAECGTRFNVSIYLNRVQCIIDTRDPRCGTFDGNYLSVTSMVSFIRKPEILQKSYDAAVGRLVESKVIETYRENTSTRY